MRGITILPSTYLSRVYRCDRAYHADQPVRDAALRPFEDRQREVDAILPAFMTSDHRVTGEMTNTIWATLADLSVQPDSERDGIGFIAELASPAARSGFGSVWVLPRGSTLRLLNAYWDVRGYGYLAGVFYDLAVESGPQAGATVTVGDYARSSWANGVPRRTIAAALIVPIDAPEVRDPSAGLVRYERVVEVLRAAGVPTNRRDGAQEPMTQASDRIAVGAPFGANEAPD